MKLSTINLALLGFIFCLTSNAFAQKKGDKSALFLNYTFEKFNSKDIEISDPGQIGLFKGLKPSTSFPADAFYGSGDFGVGNNMYGFANPIDFKNERFQGGDDKLFASDEEVIEKIKIKEIITVLTRSADSAEVAASVVEGIMVKVS